MFKTGYKGVKELLPNTIKNSIDLSTLKDGSNCVYHCTTFERVNKILKTNEFKCHSSYSDKTPHICCSHKVNYTVFSDSKIQIVLSKEKLEKDFTAKPMDLYGEDYEGELRYYVKEGNNKSIYNFVQYISEIRISETSLSGLFLHDLLKLNCSFDVTNLLIKGDIELDDLDFEELSEVLKLEKLCRENKIKVCNRLKELIDFNRGLFDLGRISKLRDTEFTLYQEEHNIQKYKMLYQEIQWGNYSVFSGYYTDEDLKEILTKMMEKCQNLVRGEVLELYNKLCVNGITEKC